MVNIYTSKFRAPKYIKQIEIELKGNTDISAITDGDFYTQF